jgi:ectoine hydroxylase-related dioxygenase (phytanoyl-CoA dioxygenase family)
MSDITDNELADRVSQVRETGYTILENLVPATVVEELAEAFQPVYESHLDAIRNDPNRGPMRHYIGLPLLPPFYQAAYSGNPTIFIIVRALLGESAYCAQFASDTPAKGSIYQDWHADIGVVFHDYDECLLPPSVIAVNMSLVDITIENGPVEICEGSHLISHAIEKLNNDELSYKPLCMKAGDVLIRDPRCVHRGSPNTKDTPRPVLVLGFDRGTHLRFGRYDHISTSTDFYESLSESEKCMYRFVPRSA